jgi:hypothetical protein
MPLNDDADYNPGEIFPDRDQYREYARMAFRTHRRRDPERHDRLQQAIRHLTDSPEEAQALVRLVAQLERDEGMVVQESDLGGVLHSLRDGSDPRDALRERRQSREDRGSPGRMSPEEEQDRLHTESPQTWMPDKPRERVQTRAERVEDAIIRADLPPDAEGRLRRLIRTLEQSGGPVSNGLVRQLSNYLRSGLSDGAILARY